MSEENEPHPINAREQWYMSEWLVFYNEAVARGSITPSSYANNRAQQKLSWAETLEKKPWEE